MDSKLIIDILNEEHSGDISSERVLQTTIDQLSGRYPCKPIQLESKNGGIKGSDHLKKGKKGVGEKRGRP